MIFVKLVSTKIYDKRDDFDFEIANFPFLDGAAISLSALVLLDHLAMLLTSTFIIEC